MRKLIVLFLCLEIPISAITVDGNSNVCITKFSYTISDENSEGIRKPFVDGCKWIKKGIVLPWTGDCQGIMIVLIQYFINKGCML